MNPSGPLRPGEVEVPKEPQAETSENLAPSPQKPAVEKPEQSLKEEPPEMVIEESTQTSAEPVPSQQEPVLSNYPSDIEEGDVKDDPLNTTGQARDLTNAINQLQRR